MPRLVFAQRPNKYPFIVLSSHSSSCTIHMNMAKLLKKPLKLALVQLASGMLPLLLAVLIHKKDMK